jgi:L-lysine 2,3-aminomutase
MFLHYMKSSQGLWVYDTEEKDLQKAITFIGDRPSIKETLRILLSGNGGFTASDGQSYSVKDNLDLFFIDYLPRVYGFNPNNAK